MTLDPERLAAINAEVEAWAAKLRPIPVLNPKLSGPAPQIEAAAAYVNTLAQRAYDLDDDDCDVATRARDLFWTMEKVRQDVYVVEEGLATYRKPS